MLAVIWGSGAVVFPRRVYVLFYECLQVRLIRGLGLILVLGKHVQESMPVGQLVFSAVHPRRFRGPAGLVQCALSVNDLLAADMVTFEEPIACTAGTSAVAAVLIIAISAGRVVCPLSTTVCLHMVGAIPPCWAPVGLGFHARASVVHVRLASRLRASAHLSRQAAPSAHGRSLSCM